ncbi:unnamed protein product [Caenorhabditis auriculariae]|uniref:Uncharacterized protein n=1 Tax=Caenorhabditis auriculariae TaxID=2777116 RepID=A0A8S1HLN8_9PELO|nr:unnamed protein product [Caenorhabditis auriculariae]
MSQLRPHLAVVFVVAVVVVVVVALVVLVSSRLFFVQTESVNNRTSNLFHSRQTPAAHAELLNLVNSQPQYSLVDSQREPRLVNSQLQYSLVDSQRQLSLVNSQCQLRVNSPMAFAANSHLKLVNSQPLVNSQFPSFLPLLSSLITPFPPRSFALANCLSILLPLPSPCVSPQTLLNVF